MEFMLDPSILAGLATLIVLEVVLGIDNLVFIAILADKLPPHQRDKARLMGLGLALFMRLGLLASIAWIVGLTAPVFSIGAMEFSWRDIILASGGLFLLVKATKEIHQRLEGEGHHGVGGPAHAAFWVVIAQIIALDAVFSINSIITAVGMVDQLWVMMTAVVVAMAIMIVASKPLTSFVGRHPTVIILCLSFLLLIGCSLIAEGFGFHIPKGYLYAAIGFSILIEVFNQMSSNNRRKALAHIPLRRRAADSIYRLLTPATAHQGNGEAAEEGGSADREGEAFQPAEQQMIRGVIELADRPVRAIMTPRAEIFWVDVNDDAPTNRTRLIESGRTRVLICRGGLDGMIGVVETRVILSALLRDERVDLGALAQRPLIVPDTLSALRLIDVLRETGERFAIVVDAHGNIDGVVSSTDIFAAIAGDLAEDEDEGEILRVDEQAIEVDASITFAALSAALDRPAPADVGRYTSLGGFLLFEFGRMPEEGESIERAGFGFTIRSTRARQIEKVEVRVLENAAE